MRAVFILLFLTFVSSNLFANLEKSVVRIASTLSLYDYKYPWKKPKTKDITGSGVIIENKYILTAAHVVSSSEKITIRKSNSYKKYYAQIKYISEQADLALLKISDENFFKDTKALKISRKIKANDKILAAGYPDSRTSLFVKKGFVSKLDYMDYSFSNENLLGLELDISIMHGNSGGPILNEKKELVAIAMQVAKNSKNRAYAIPSFIINTFLEDIKDEKVDGFHSNSNSYQSLKNKAFKNYYKTDKSGILVNDIDINEKQLKINDIILEINDLKTSDISEKSFLSHFHSKPVRESIKLSILRDSKIIDLDYKLNISRKLLTQEFASKPRYFTFGGLVFTPITRNYLQAISMKQYEMNMLFYEQKRTLEKEEFVAWMERKFPKEINEDYTSKVEILDKVNNTKIRSFKHFKKLIKESKQKYIVLDFLNKQRVVLKKNEALLGEGN